MPDRFDFINGTDLVQHFVSRRTVLLRQRPFPLGYRNRPVPTSLPTADRVLFCLLNLISAEQLTVVPVKLENAKRFPVSGIDRKNVRPVSPRFILEPVRTTPTG